MDNNVGTITLSTEVDTKGVDKGLVDIERKVTGKGFMDKFSRMFNGIFSKVSSGANKITSSIGKGLGSILKGLGSILTSVGGIAGIIAKISLIGIIGMIILAANYSETSKAQLQEIATIVLNLAEVLVNLILPTAEAIVDAIYQGVKWVAKLLNSWFGIDLFAKRTDKSLKNGVKSAKALRKQLLGFDEMNILNKDGSIGGIGTTTGGTGPGGGEGAKKTGKSIGKAIIDSALGMLGKSNVIAKVTRKINQATVVSGFGLPILKLLFGKDEDGIIGDVQKVLKSCLGIFGLFGRKAGDEFNNFSVAYKNGMVEVTTSTGQVVKMTEQQYKDMMKKLGINANETFDLIKGGVVGVQGAFKNTSNENKKSWFDTATSIILKYTGKGQDAVKGAIESGFNSIKDTSKKDSDDTKTNWFNSATDIIKKYTGKGQDGVVGAITSGINAIPQSVETNTKSALNIANDMINKFNPASKKVNIIATLDTSKMMATLKKMASSWPMAFEPIVKALQKQGFAKGGIVGIPRLASGGIINKPGRGVPLAVGGEVSREGVIPMDNQSQMALLGREIAKNIVINLTSVTELDGRQLARTTAQVMNEMNFASNGGVI